MGRVRWLQSLRGFLFGAASTWVMAPFVLQRREHLERIFVLLTVPELGGLPSLAPPLLRLQILPFLMPQLLSWRRALALWDEDLEMVDLKHLGH